PRASENGAVFFEIPLSRLAKISIRRQIDKKQKLLINERANEQPSQTGTGRKNLHAADTDGQRKRKGGGHFVAAREHGLHHA
ncbi:MAG TPA: hypothetical protein VFC17_07715, partial [Candidatus Limnocylindrales bacterium]|nr:hypothetical protein [Candidatus Limnocylindrales bacterium]